MVRKVSKGALAGDAAYEGALKNTGAGLRLFNASCELADEIPAGAWPAGNNTTKQTMERTVGFTWQTSVLAGGTPGRENSIPTLRKEIGTPTGNVGEIKIEDQNKEILKAHSSKLTAEDEIILSYPPILINEIFVGDEGANDSEYIELWNPSDEMVPLTGWAVKKRSSTGAVSSLVSASRLEGKAVPAKGYFLVANEGGYRGSPVPDALWAKSNTLAYSNNAVLLINPKGEVIQEVSWTEIPKGGSFSRDANGNFLVSGKSPKQPN